MRLAAALALLALLQDPKPAEKIAWEKDLDAAFAQSAKDGRPVVTYWTFEG